MLKDMLEIILRPGIWAGALLAFVIPFGISRVMKRLKG